MKFLIQVVNEASVNVNNLTIGKIDKGYLIFIGISDLDTYELADKMIKKVANLRIFQDENGKTNLSIKDVNGSILAVSQFTLYADCKKGNRPSFINAGKPDLANDLYEYIKLKFKEDYDLHVESGEFGADMKVSLINNGPFTIMLDSKEIFDM